MAQRVVLDTDIGTDVDDLFALAFLLASPELRLCGVTLVHGDVRLRASIVLKLLDAAGIAGIPLSLGAGDPMQFGLPVHWTGQEGHGLELEPPDPGRLDGRSAVSFLLERIGEAPGNLGLITIGPLTNAGLLARDHPGAFRALQAVSIMGGNYHPPGARPVTAEHNFRCDPEAASRVLETAPACRLVGLNVTRRTALTGGLLKELEALGTPAGTLLARAAWHYLRQTGRDATPMHDPLAVAAHFRPELFRWERLVPVVQTAGDGAGVVTFRRGDGGERGVSVAVDADIPAFQELFRERILAFASRA